MAKRNEDNEFDDFDFDNFDDDGGAGDFEAAEVPKGRKVVESVAGGFVSGMAKSVTDPGRQRELIGKALPEGYVRGYDAARETARSTKELYNTAATEYGKAKKQVQQSVKSALPALGGMLPSGLRTRVEKWASAADSASYARVDPNQTEMETGLGDIFNKYQGSSAANMASGGGNMSSSDAQGGSYDGEGPGLSTKDKMEIAATTQTAITEMMSAEQNQEQLKELKDIRIGIQKQVSYQDQVTINYQRKSLELQYRQLFETKKILDTSEKSLALDKASYDVLAKNTAMPDLVKLHLSEAGMRHLALGFLGKAAEPMADRFGQIGQKMMAKAKAKITGTIRDVSSGISDGLGAAGMASEMTGGEGGPGMGEMAGEMAGEAAGGMAGTRLGNRIAEEIKKRTGDNGKVLAGGKGISNLLDNFVRIFNTGVKRGDTGYKRVDQIIDMLGLSDFKQVRNDTLQTSMVDDLEKNAHFNLQTRKAITDIIPGFLSRILREVQIIRTGDDTTELTNFSFETGQFEGAGVGRERLKEKLMGKRVVDPVREETDKIYKSLVGEAELSISAQTALKRYIFVKTTNNDVLNPATLASFASDLTSQNPADVDEVRNAVKEHFNFKDEDLQNQGSGSIKDLKALMSLDPELQNKLEVTTKGMKDLKRAAPDFKNDALKDFSYGNIERWKELGLTKLVGTTHQLDYEKYMDFMLGYGGDSMGPSPGAPTPPTPGNPNPGAGPAPGGLPPIIPPPAPIPPAGGTPPTPVDLIRRDRPNRSPSNPNPGAAPPPGALPPDPEVTPATPVDLIRHNRPTRTPPTPPPVAEETTASSEKPGKKPRSKSSRRRSKRKPPTAGGGVDTNPEPDVDTEEAPTPENQRTMYNYAGLRAAYNVFPNAARGAVSQPASVNLPEFTPDEPTPETAPPSLRYTPVAERAGRFGSTFIPTAQPSDAPASKKPGFLRRMLGGAAAAIGGVAASTGAFAAETMQAAHDVIVPSLTVGDGATLVIAAAGASLASLGLSRFLRGRKKKREEESRSNEPPVIDVDQVDPEPTPATPSAAVRATPSPLPNLLPSSGNDVKELVDVLREMNVREGFEETQDILEDMLSVMAAGGAGSMFGNLGSRIKFRVGKIGKGLAKRYRRMSGFLKEQYEGFKSGKLAYFSDKLASVAKKIPGLSTIGGKIVDGAKWAKNGVTGLFNKLPSGKDLWQKGKDLFNKIPKLGELKDKGLALLKKIPGAASLKKVGESLKNAGGRVRDLAGIGSMWVKTKLGMNFDVFSGGELILTAVDLAKGKYRDLASGKVVRLPHLIKGPLINDQDQQVLTQAHIDAGLTNQNGKPFKIGIGARIKGLVKGAIGAVGSIGSRAFVKLVAGKDFVKGFFKKGFDIWVTGETEPAITAKMLKKDLLFDIKSQKPVKSIADITGPVVTGMGNMVLTQEQFDAGLIQKDERGMIRKSISAARKLGGMLLGKMPKLTFSFKAMKDRVMDLFTTKYDIYVKEGTEPVLFYNGIKNGDYVDQKTAKIITKLEDITGPVIDKIACVKVTQEQFDKGLEARNRKGIVARLKGAANSLKDSISSKILRITGLGQIAKMAIDNFFYPKDVYVTGEATPRLFADKLKAKKYFLKATGKVVKHPGKITGEVVDDQGNMVLSNDDLQKGLVDANGKPFKTLFQKIMSGPKKLLGGIGRGIMAVGRGLKEAGARTLNAMGNAKDWIMDKLGFGEGDGKKKPKRMTTLQKIHAILEERLPKPKKAKLGDADGDGVREGSAEDQKNQREKAKQGLIGRLKDRASALKETVKEKASVAKNFLGDLLKSPKTLLALGGAGIGAMLASLFGKDENGENRVDPSTGAVVGGVTALGVAAAGWKGAKWVAGKAWQGAKAVVRGGAKLAWQGVKTVGRFVARQVTGGVVRAVAGQALRSGLMYAGSALAAAVSAPVLLTAAAVAVVAVGGYLLYKHMTKETTPLVNFRMAQYGFELSDNKRSGKILEFEKLCLDNTIASKGKPAELGKGVATEKAIQIFGIDQKDEKQLKRFLHWFQYRFKPVFLSNVTQMVAISGGKDLQKADTALSKAQKTKLLQGAHFTETKSNPYAQAPSPFPDDDEVKLKYDDVVDLYKKTLKDVEAQKDSKGDAKTKIEDKKRAEAEKKEESWTDSTKNAMSTLAKGAKDAMSSAWDFTKNAAGGLLDTAVNFTKGLIGEKNYNTAVNAVSNGMTAVADSVMGVPANLSKSAKEMQLMVYQAFLNAGFSKPQAMAMTAEVGRENDYQQQYLFGKHTDPKNKVTNQGFFSWQGDKPGDRRNLLVQRMLKKGLVAPNGDFIPGQASLNEMALFARNEIESIDLYKSTKNQFLANPNIDSEQAAQVLGRNYIRWAIDNPKYSPKGQKRRRDHLAALVKQIGNGPAVTPAAATPGGVPATASSPTGTAPAGSVPTGGAAAAPAAGGAIGSAQGSSSATTPTFTQLPGKPSPGSGTPPQILADFVARNAKSKSIGQCAAFVSNGMQAAGYKIGRGNADTYIQKSITPAGFVKIPWGSAPQPGDLVHWTETPKHRYGHIQVWSGTHWVSDFVQNRICPYRDQDGSIGTHWRDRRYLNGATVAPNTPAMPGAQQPAAAPIAAATAPVRLQAQTQAQPQVQRMAATPTPYATQTMVQPSNDQAQANFGMSNRILQDQLATQIAMAKDVSMIVKMMQNKPASSPSSTTTSTPSAANQPATESPKPEQVIKPSQIRREMKNEEPPVSLRSI